MHKKSKESDEPTQQQALEHRVKEMMGGPSDQDPKDAQDEDDHDPPERVLVIPPSSDKPVPDTLPGAPLVDDSDPAEAVAEETSAAPDETEETTEEPSEDAATEQAVDDIARQEGDTALAAEDAELEKAFKEPHRRGWRQKLADFLRAWWGNKKARYTTLAALSVLIITLGTVPVTRYFVLNLAGVRGSASMTIVDDSTQLPLKNVQVSVGSQSSTSDVDGAVRLTHIKLGSSKLVIKKRAFAAKTIPLTVGWGSNPLGSYSITATGARYTFIVKDFLSNKAIEKAEASSGDASAVSDKNGKIILTADTSDEPTLTVTIKATNYRDEKLTFNADTKADQTVAAVPARKEVFVSKRSGKYDVYKVDVDGKNEKLVLAGTGNERDDLALVSHPTDEVAALVSTRDNVRDKDGYLLSTLTLLDLHDGSNAKLAQSEQIQIVGWVGTRLLYVQIAAGASATNPKRFRLISYDYKTVDKTELASANSFNDLMLVDGNVYIAPASSYQADSNIGLIRISADGQTKKTILPQEVWNIFRVSYDTFDLSTQNAWYEYKLGSTAATKLAAAPANPKTRLYINSADTKHSLWVDQRDGKGVLLNYDIVAKTDKTLETQSGLNNPVRWLTNDTLIYRIQTPTETADYVLNIDGGEAHKIKDVSATAGLGLWYYY